MFIADMELLKDGKLLGLKIKQWVAQLNLAAKSSGARTFAVNGPANLLVRNRAGRTNYNFIGGEQLRLSSVVLDRKLDKQGVEVNVIFQPADTAILTAFSSMTLPLQTALDHFSDLEEWTQVASIETDSASEEKKHIAEVMATIPTVEETRASETWGAW